MPPFPAPQDVPEDAPERQDATYLWRDLLQLHDAYPMHCLFGGGETWEWWLQWEVSLEGDITRLFPAGCDTPQARGMHGQSPRQAAAVQLTKAHPGPIHPSQPSCYR